MTLSKLPCARLTSLFKQGQLAKHIARSDELLSEARGATFVAPFSETEKALAKIYAGIFNLAESETLASDNFFELGGTSIDVIRSAHPFCPEMTLTNTYHLQTQARR
jgi:hypothetical protein